MCDCYDAEQPSCSTTSYPKARKRHKCCECRGWIEVGEKYEKVTGIWDGCAFTHKTCQDCQELRVAIMKEEGCPCFVFENLPDEVMEMDCEKYTVPFIAILRKRGATIHESWLRRERELAERGGASIARGEAIH